MCTTIILKNVMHYLTNMFVGPSWNSKSQVRLKFPYLLLAEGIKVETWCQGRKSLFGFRTTYLNLIWKDEPEKNLHLAWIWFLELRYLLGNLLKVKFLLEDTYEILELTFLWWLSLLLKSSKDIDHRFLRYCFVKEIWSA